MVENECIEVYGTLVIDHGIRFENCDFIMDAGALIRTQSMFSPISFIKCNLQSCGDYFWDGIQLGWGNRLIFIENNMQHAFNGINSLYAPVQCFITDNVFNDNRIAINLEDNDFVQYFRSTLVLSGNIFGQSNLLKLHWEEYPHSDHKRSVGLRANFAMVNATVGNDPCGRTNIFVGLVDGMELTNSVAEIHSNLFHDFRISGSGINNGIIGYPLRTIDWPHSYLNQSGWLTNHIESFKGIESAIYWEGAGRIMRNFISDSWFGIHLNMPLSIGDIRNNRIYTKKFGIWVTFTNNARTSISNNIINVQYPGAGTPSQYSAGILAFNISGGSIQGGSFSANDLKSLSIARNSITLENGYDGIHAYGTGTIDYNIFCNNIFNVNQNEPGGITHLNGILVETVTRVRLWGNNISGSNPNPLSSIGEINGIKIVESQMTSLESNTISNTQIGLHFSNFNGNTVQENNSFFNHNIGYYVSETGVTGDQFFSRNQWFGSYSDWAAQNEGDENLSKYYDYQNFVGTTCWPNTIDPGMDWFIPEQGIGNCIDQVFNDVCTQAEPVPPERESLTSLDELVARGELEFDDFSDRRLWQTQRYLLSKLMDYPDLIGSSGSLMDTFFNNALNSSLWEYHEIRTAIQNYSTVPESVDSIWSDYHGIYENLVDDANVVIQNWVNQPDSVTLIEPISEVFEQIDSIWTLSATEVQNWLSYSITNLQNLLPAIGNLSTPNLYAANEKLILKASVLMFLDKDSLSQSMVNQLIQLSESCMLEHGPAVIDARGMVKMLGFNPGHLQLNCSQYSELRRVDPNLFSVSSFEVYPNPNSSGTVNLKFDRDVVENGKVEFYDNIGRLIFSKTISTVSGIVTVSVDHLPPCHYVVKVKINNTEEVQSLIITR
ncbi:MAG: T9SS C-terminal target domain-containing protein [Saprospirales bacterium]|nr:MAG: T9SS C-terminal target domain-containing protein [Saprospirales bacterium]